MKQFDILLPCRLVLNLWCHFVELSGNFSNLFRLQCRHGILCITNITAPNGNKWHFPSGLLWGKIILPSEIRIWTVSRKWSQLIPPPNQLTSHFGNIRLYDCGWMEWIKFQSIQSENGFILVKYLISLHNASVDRIKSFDTNFRYPQFSNSISNSLNANFHSKFMFFMEIPRMDIQIFISFRILKMIYRKFDLQNTNDVWEIPNFCTNSYFFDEFRFIWSD